MRQLVRYDKRALALIEHFHIEVESLGIYPRDSELERIEYVIHEIAHAFTMGFTQMPRRLSASIEGTLAKFSKATSDQLEIDTAFVTHQAMVELGLAKSEDQHKFAAKCASALLDNRNSERVYLVLDEMEMRNEDAALAEHVNMLVSVMRGPLKSVLSIYSLPDESPGAPLLRVAGLNV